MENQKAEDEGDQGGVIFGGLVCFVFSISALMVYMQ